MEKETKKCPYCGGEILAVAKKCKHCGEWLEEQKQSEENIETTETNSNPIHITTHKPHIWDRLLYAYYFCPNSWLLKEFKYEDGTLSVSCMNGNEITAPIDKCLLRSNATHERFSSGNNGRIEFYIESGESKLHFVEMTGMLEDYEWTFIKNFFLTETNEIEVLCQGYKDIMEAEIAEANTSASKVVNKIKYTLKALLALFFCFLFLSFAFVVIEDWRTPTMEGTWNHNWSYTTTDFAEDDFIKEWTENYEGIDECTENGSDIDKGLHEYIFKIEDVDGFSGEITLKYNSTYIGTWEQNEDTIFWTGQDQKYELVYSSISPETENSEDYLAWFITYMDREILPMSEEDKERRTVLIDDVNYNENTITLNEDGDFTTLKKIDGDIKKKFFWKPYRVGKKKE